MAVSTPDDYGDWRAEARAIRTGVAVVGLDHLDVLRLRGRDARDFLHRLTSADLKRVPEARAVPAALLTPKARVVCSLTLVPQPGEVLCILSRDHVEAVKEYLDRFIIADDVELTSGQHELVGVYGVGLPSIEALGPLDQLEAYRVAELSLMQGSYLALGDDHLATPGVQIIVGAGEADELRAQLARAGARRVGWSAYHSCRVEAGTPAMGQELSEDVLVLEAGQLAAVSFDKGCYPGQEPVCRIQSRGQVNRRLVGLRFGPEGALRPGAALQHPDKADAGRVSSVAQSAHLAEWIGLGYVHRKLAAPGTVLQLAGGGEALVSALPHVQSGVWPLTCPRYKDEDRPET